MVRPETELVRYLARRGRRCALATPGGASALGGGIPSGSLIWVRAPAALKVNVVTPESERAKVQVPSAFWLRVPIVLAVVAQ